MLQSMGLQRVTHNLATIQHQHNNSVSSVQSLSRVRRPHESQHSRPPCPSPTPGVHSKSRRCIIMLLPLLLSRFSPVGLYETP